MVQSEEKEPYERYNGLTRFAEEHGFAHAYLNTVKKQENPSEGSVHARE